MSIKIDIHNNNKEWLILSNNNTSKDSLAPHIQFICMRRAPFVRDNLCFFLEWHRFWKGHFPNTWRGTVFSQLIRRLQRTKKEIPWSTRKACCQTNLLHILMLYNDRYYLSDYILRETWLYGFQNDFNHRWYFSYYRCRGTVLFSALITCSVMATLLYTVRSLIQPRESISAKTALKYQT